MALRRTPLGFMLKAALVALTVLAAAVAFYVIADPFMVIGRHDYFPDPVREKLRISANKGMATVRNYERQVSQGREYNAFIFGSSISCYYDPAEWARILGGDVRPYHFDSSSETLTQMAQKVEYLHHKGQKIEYALVVLDPWVMQEHDEESPYMVSPPELDGTLMHRLKFYYTFFRASTNADFLKSYIYSNFTGEPSTVGRNRVYEEQPIVYDPVTNHESMPEWDSLIAHDPARFYAEHPLMSSPQKAVQAPVTIKDEYRDALERIARIFAADGTEYQVIIGPNRRKVTTNESDRRQLYALFGKDRVHDFSAILVDALECDTLLYDNVHYRPSFASRLLRAAYGR